MILKLSRIHQRCSVGEKCARRAPTAHIERSLSPSSSPPCPEILLLDSPELEDRIVALLEPILRRWNLSRDEDTQAP